MAAKDAADILAWFAPLFFHRKMSLTRCEGRQADPASKRTLVASANVGQLSN